MLSNTKSRTAGKTSKPILYSAIIISLFSIVMIGGCKKETKATCTDGIKNGTETAVDCGGSCNACLDTLTISQKCVGTWKVGIYLLNNQDQTVYYDTTYRDYFLKIDTPYNQFLIQWNDYTFTNDSVLYNDSLGNPHVSHFVDTTITPHFGLTGSWNVINTNADLELSGGFTMTYHILGVSSDSLKLQKGNEEYHFWKFH